MTTPGRLIALEGGEGAGKSTQAALLAAAIGAEQTREPGGSDLGERVRALLLDPSTGEIDDRAELFLMLAARSQHLAERIRPGLAGGRHVVVDRFSGSTLAYQGYGRGLPLADVRRACDLATAGCWPDLTLLLDLPAALGAARRSGVPDRIEGADGGFHERVTGGFRELAAAEPSSWVVIDASQGVDEVARDVLAAVGERLGIRPVVPR